MSEMSTAIAAAMSELWDFAADSGTFTPDGGQPTPLQVKIIKQEFDDLNDSDLKVSGLEIRAKAMIADLPSIPVAKTQSRNGDVFAVGSVNYEVVEIAERDAVFITCAVREVS